MQTCLRQFCNYSFVYISYSCTVLLIPIATAKSVGLRASFLAHICLTVVSKRAVHARKNRQWEWSLIRAVLDNILHFVCIQFSFLYYIFVITCPLAGERIFYISNPFYIHLFSHLHCILYILYLFFFKPHSLSKISDLVILLMLWIYFFTVLSCSITVILIKHLQLFSIFISGLFCFTV